MGVIISDPPSPAAYISREFVNVKQTTGGECREQTYVHGKLEGLATVIFPESVKEM